MKILVLTTTFPRWKNDSTASFVDQLSERMKDRHTEIIVLAPHYEGAKKFEIMDGMKIYRFPYFYPYRYQKLAYDGGVLSNIKRSHLAKVQIPLFFLSELYYTFKIIKKEQVDVIHSHWIIPGGLVGAISRQIFDIYHMTSAHAGDVFTMRNSKIFTDIGSYVFKNSDKITANSSFTRDVIVSMDNKIDKIEIIPMGVDTVRFSPTRVSNLRETFMAEYIVLSIGRLVEKKGVKYLIIAMKEIIKKFPKAKLIIGGSGPDMKILEELSKSLDLQNNVIFVGYISNEDLPKYYASSDIFVLPSIETKEGDTEGLGIVLLEAMASNVPVVGSNIGGITDIIIDNETGLLTKPEDPKDISEKIVTLLSDKKLRQRLSEKGLKTVNERFSWNLIAEQFKKLLTYKNE